MHEGLTWQWRATGLNVDFEAKKKEEGLKKHIAIKIHCGCTYCECPLEGARGGSHMTECRIMWGSVHLTSSYVLACVGVCVQTFKDNTAMLNPKSVYWLLLVNLEPLWKPPALLLREGTLTPNRPNRSELGWRRRSLCPCCASKRKAGSQGDGGRAWSGGHCAWSACRTADTRSASPPCACGCGAPARPSGQISWRSPARCTERAAHLQHGGRGEERKVMNSALCCFYILFSTFRVLEIVKGSWCWLGGGESLNKGLQQNSEKLNISPFCLQSGLKKMMRVWLPVESDLCLNLTSLKGEIKENKG